VHPWRFRDRRVIELREFHEKDEALEAIGREGWATSDGERVVGES
jgi:hypothetical protein